MLSSLPPCGTTVVPMRSAASAWHGQPQRGHPAPPPTATRPLPGPLAEERAAYHLGLISIGRHSGRCPGVSCGVLRQVAGVGAGLERSATRRLLPLSRSRFLSGFPPGRASRPRRTRHTTAPLASISCPSRFERHHAADPGRGGVSGRERGARSPACAADQKAMRNPTFTKWSSRDLSPKRPE